jgi:hypothetical protein
MSPLFAQYNFTCPQYPNPLEATGRRISVITHTASITVRASLYNSAKAALF